MAITVTWPTKVINIPKADTLLIQSMPTEIRSLDIDAFRLTLKSLEAGEEGMPYLHTHTHNQPVTVGGVTLARVVEIINGYTVTFEDGQYAVNLVGANSNIGDVTNVNQVSVRSANSAGLTFSKTLEDQAFRDGRVWINTVSGLPGTSYPRGTESDPVDSLADAQTIIAARGLPKRLGFTGTITTSASDDLSDYDIIGASANLSTLDITTGTNTNNLVLEAMTMLGDLNGNITAKRAVSFSAITDFDGLMIECGLAGTVDLGSGGGLMHQFINCYSDVAGAGTPTVDCDDIVGGDVQFRNYSGGLVIQNFSDAGGNMSIDLNQGSVTLDATCTAGSILVRGTGVLTDNSGAGCTVITSGLVRPNKLLTVAKFLGLK